jgi:ABC-2 type transport system permease protein
MISAAAIGLAKAGAIFKRDAKLALSYEAQFFMQWLAVLAEVVITYFISTIVPPSPHFGFAGKEEGFFSYAIVNLAFVNLQTTALVNFSKTVRDGQLQGTLEALLATPTNLPIIILSGGLWAFTFTLLTTGLMLLVALPFGLDLRHTNLLTMAVFLVLTIAALSPLGVLSAAATMIFKQNAPFDFALTMLSYMFAGVYVPVALLPHPLQVLGWMLPITHSLTGFRAAVAGAAVTQVGGEVVWLLAAIALLVPFSLMAFERAVAYAKADGTLGAY